MKILVTGSAGFICGYLVEELLKAGHEVVGIDNFSKYGPVKKSYDNHPNYHFTRGDVKDLDLMKSLIKDCDQVLGAAAMIGGISYFHTFAYDLLAENERIAAATFDAAIWAKKNARLKKINVLSSSMVFENTGVYPTPETEARWAAAASHPDAEDLEAAKEAAKAVRQIVTGEDPYAELKAKMAAEAEKQA